MIDTTLIAGCSCVCGGYLIGSVFGKFASERKSRRTEFKLLRDLFSAKEQLHEARTEISRYRKADRERHALLSAAGRKGRAKQIAAQPKVTETERERRRRKTDEMRAEMNLPPINWEDRLALEALR